MNETPLTREDLNPKQQRTYDIVCRIHLAVNRATPSLEYFLEHYREPVLSYYREQGINESEELLTYWHNKLEGSSEDLMLVKLERTMPVSPTRYYGTQNRQIQFAP